MIPRPIPRFNALLALLALPLAAFAQNPGARMHDGFYLSLSAGGAGGTTEADLTGAAGSWDNIKFTGPGGIVDLKIGGAVAPNFIVSFDLIGRNVPGPKLETIGGTETLDEDVVLSDGTAGLGLTYYLMPSNVFVSGTLGVARFTFQDLDDEDSDPVQTNPGLSLHAKIGKEWWVSDNWGLGVALGYGFVGAERDEDGNNDEFNGDYASHKVYLLFNTTFN
jgi:hypothetical protein